jgi:hypothetical protein
MDASEDEETEWSSERLLTSPEEKEEEEEEEEVEVEVDDEVSRRWESIFCTRWWRCSFAALSLLPSEWVLCLTMFLLL